ncbi:MAG: MATE family efflux transporter, partial [Paracoccaceae bacterium]|nr:MATE family efflux transporter [Paracoccaceae bacterium]
AKVPMVMASVSYWGLGIPASYVFAFVLGYGAMGIWAGLVVGLSLAAILLMARFWRGAARQVEMPKA